MNNYKIGIVVGAWDLLHAGHIHLLKQCKKRCDRLIVGLHVDPSIERKDKNKPVESLLEREIKLLGCKYVDGIIVYEKESDLSLIFKYFNINVRFLGSDYVGKIDKITAIHDILIEYIDSLPIHTTDLRKRL